MNARSVEIPDGPPPTIATRFMTSWWSEAENGSWDVDGSRKRCAAEWFKSKSENTRRIQDFPIIIVVATASQVAIN